MDYKYLKETSEQLDEIEQEYTETHYPTSQVYKGLGLTRDALRYYEELGILAPSKNQENSYREYDINDIWNLLVIDFYKKRGVTPKELKQAKEAGSHEGYKELLLQKKSQIEENIKYEKKMLKKLEATIEFSETIEKELNVFQIKELPLYEIEEELTSIINFKEYRRKILEHIDVSEDDILPNMVRMLEVDGEGYTGSKGYFVKKAGRKRKGRKYLESGESLYTTIADQEESEENLMEKMFVACMEWAEEHGRKFKGMVYLQARYIYLAGDQMNSYLECWVPLEKE